MRPEQTFVEKYEWIHTWVGVAGNVLFFTGSVLFLWESTKSIGTWMFIVGSGLMLVGSVGSALVQKARARRRRHGRADPQIDRDRRSGYRPARRELSTSTDARSEARSMS